MASTDETQQKYRLAGAVLAQRWCGVDEMGNATMVCAAFAGRARTGRYATSTLRLYREQVLAYVRTLPHEAAQVAAVRNMPLGRYGVNSDRTSAKKLQRISQEDAQALRLHMSRDVTSEIATMAGAFFEAGLMFGLRPVEWCSAKLEVFEAGWSHDVSAVDGLSPTHRLTVLNAKANSLRGNGVTRSIYSELTIEQASLVLTVIAWATERQEDWELWYKRLTNALYYGARSLWPRRKRVPSFYTSRHQCIANAKASDAPPNELAAMFGHASDWTARKHYSGKINGDKSRHMIRASRVSLEGVRNQTQSALSASLSVAAVENAKSSTNDGA